MLYQPTTWIPPNSERPLRATAIPTYVSSWSAPAFSFQKKTHWLKQDFSGSCVYSIIRIQASQHSGINTMWPAKCDLSKETGLQAIPTVCLDWFHNRLACDMRQSQCQINVTPVVRITRQVTGGCLEEFELNLSEIRCVLYKSLHLPVNPQTLLRAPYIDVFESLSNFVPTYRVLRIV